MNQEIREGLLVIFKELPDLSANFNKHTYASVSQNRRKKWDPLFKQIAEYVDNAKDREEAIREVAGILPDAMKNLLKDEKKKSLKEKILVNYNIALVTYVIPLMRYHRDDTMEDVVDEMIRQWNDNGTSMNVGKSTVDEISGGFKWRPCYITTAVCESLGKEDDCYELNLFRDYRDNQLLKEEDGEALVREYYDVAPTIVTHIGRRCDAAEIYHGIWSDYLKPCMEELESENYASCKELYKTMVNELKKQYFIV